MREKKIARICWNSFGWTKPSGYRGKSKNKNSFEYQYGFGHEEWLLDTTKVINGHHYGFLQAVGQHYDKYVGQNFDVFLYAIDSETQCRWWLGRICNLTVIDPDEQSRIALEYRRLGWLNEMEQQLNQVRNSNDDLPFDRNLLVTFNIKFKIDDLLLQDPPISFDKDDVAVSSNYYNLLNFITEPKSVRGLKPFQFRPGHKPGKTSTSGGYEGKSKDIDLAEKRMQTDIFNYLCTVHGKKNVGTEQLTGYGTAIDIVVKNINKADKTTFTFYELKVSDSPLKAIRNALGQLLEYCYFPKECRADCLIIVSHHKITNEMREYLDTLRNSLAVSVFYQRFDVEAKKLDPELA